MRNKSLQFTVYSLQKKIILLVTSYWLLVTLLTGCAKREIKNIDSGGKNIICFGDSITFGYGANPGEDYPSQLTGMIGTPVINSGIDGYTSTEALMNIKSDVLDRDPLLVIIEFGGNDFLRKIPMETTIKNIGEMIDEIQAKGAIAAVMDISAGLLLREYRGAFYNLAKEKGAIFIPNVLAGIFTNPHLKSDFIHPNGEGYKMIAQRAYRTITPYLNQNTLAKKSGK